MKMVTQPCLKVGLLPFNHLLMVRATNDQTITEVQATSIDAAIVHALTHEVVREGSLFFPGGETLYFIRSERIEGWCYVAKWFERQQRYGCACVESRKHGYCEHQRMLEDHTGRN